MKQINQYLCETCGKQHDSAKDILLCAYPGCKTDVCLECGTGATIQVATDKVETACVILCCDKHASEVHTRLAKALTHRVVTGLIRGRNVRSDAGKPRPRPRKEKATDQPQAQEGTQNE